MTTAEITGREYLQGFRLQMRVVGALILREMRVRYGHSRLGYLWALFEPAGYVAGLSALFIYSHALPPVGRSMPLFFVLGIIPFRLVITASIQLGAAFTANQALLSFPIVHELDTIVARWILEVVTFTVILTAALCILVFGMSASGPANILTVLKGLALLSGLGLGVGLCNAVISKFAQSWLNLFRILSVPMMFLSGIFFTTQSLPPAMRAIVEWNPILHGLEIIRPGYYSNFRSPVADSNYLFWWVIISITVGLLIQRAAMNRSP